MNINDALEKLRVSYQLAELDVKDCNLEPFEQFDLWLRQAIKSDCDEPNAFVLSTVKDGQPRSRVLLLKGIHENKFVFFTNYNSSKAVDIESNDRVAMNFLWLPLQRQIRIEGVVTKTDSQFSSEYFSKRPRGSQIGAIASPQSDLVPDRKHLEDLFLKTQMNFEGIDSLPCPENWGGYFVSPTYLEFWQGRGNRMHDRICYQKNASTWELHRLAP